MKKRFASSVIFGLSAIASAALAQSKTTAPVENTAAPASPAAPTVDQTTPSEANEPAALAPVTVTAPREASRGYTAAPSGALGVDLPPQQLPATVNATSAEFLRDFGIKGLNDLANYVPGVTLNDNGGETGENLLIRGFGSNTTYVDGLRTVARYGVPRSMPDVLERIEITKGPAGAEAGVADFGGTVNLVTKKPQRAFAAEVGAGVGDYGYRKASTDVTGAVALNGALQARLIAAYEEGAEWRKGRPEKTPRYVFAPSVNWDYSSSGSLLLQHERYVQNAPQDRGIIYLEGAFPGSNFAPRDWSFHQLSGDARRAFSRTSVDWKHSFDSTWSGRARVQQYRESRHLQEFRNADTEPGDNEPNDLHNDDGRTWNGNRVIGLGYSDWAENYRTVNALAEIKSQFGVSGVLNTVRLGLESYRFKILEGTETADTFNDNTVDILEVDNNQRPQNLSFGSPSIDRGHQTQKSFYATWLGEWTPRWRTVLGLRKDRFDTNEQSFIDGTLDFEDINASNAVSWRAATSFDLTDNTTLFAGASNAFQPQSGVTSSGQQLDPTGGRSIEAGVKLSVFGGRALWTNAVYQITQNNIAVCDTSPLLDPDDIDNCRFNRLFGSARVHGVESELQGQVTRHLQLSGGVALVQSRITQTDAVYENDPVRLGQSFVGNRFANTPRVQASLAATYGWAAVGLPQLKTSLGITHVGQRFGNSGNTISLPAYTVTHLGASYQVSRATTLSLSVGNLFDKTYYTAMQDSNDRADQVSVGDRRLMQVGLSVKF